MDYVAIFLVRAPAVVLPALVSESRRGEYRVLGSLIVSMEELCENKIVVHSRLLVVMRSGNFFFRHFKVLHTTKSGIFEQNQNLNFEKCSPHAVK